MLEQELKRIWEQLRAEKSSRDTFLEEVHIRGIRGISDLRVPFSYPVTVIAGSNACGKSTVLFSLACAYKSFTPSILFPNFRSEHSKLRDISYQTELSYSYLHEEKRLRMGLKRDQEPVLHDGKSYRMGLKRVQESVNKYSPKWRKIFFGEKGKKQPERFVYLRTLANLTNPSEVRNILQIGRSKLDSEKIDAALLALAHRILPFHYNFLQILTSKTGKDILFARREEEQHCEYSEFHMSAGERAILRLSKDISLQENALVLIDEIEAGLHPYTQQQLMLELQRLSLRKKLQIIVTTHSLAVLNTVPPEGRIILERTENNVVRCPNYRDIIQKAFYGTSNDKLSILCEDSVSEGLIRGIFDNLNTELDLQHRDIDISRDTGKDEFPFHAKALAQFRLIDNFVFVLDGDARTTEAKIREAVQPSGQVPTILFLPTNQVPEQWIWNIIGKYPDEYAELFKISSKELQREIQRLNQLFESATDKPGNIAKNKFFNFCDGFLKRDMTDVCRIVGRKESREMRGDMLELVNSLKETVNRWRTANR